MKVHSERRPKPGCHGTSLSVSPIYASDTSKMNALSHFSAADDDDDDDDDDDTTLEYPLQRNAYRDTQLHSMHALSEVSVVTARLHCA